MKMNLKFILLTLGVVILVSSSPIWAVLEVNFSESLPITRIQYYWAGSSNRPTDKGESINSDPNISFNLSDPNKRAKPKVNPPSQTYIFGADENFPNSKSISIRVWDKDPQQDEAKYTSLVTFNNPTTSLNTQSFNISYSFIKAVPEKPEIYEVVDSSVKAKDGSERRELIFKSKQRPRSDNLNVEIGGYQWTVTCNGFFVNLDNASRKDDILILSSDKGFSIKAGDRYKVKVKYINLWGAEKESDEYEYVVAAAGETLVEETWELKRPSSGINTISIPFRGLDKSVTDSQNNVRDISTVHKLIKEINRQAGANVVTVFGWWDKNKQQHIGLTGNIQYSSAGDIIGAKVTGKDPSGKKYLLTEILDLPIVTNQPYQVSVVSDVTVKLKGYK